MLFSWVYKSGKNKDNFRTTLLTKKSQFVPQVFIFVYSKMKTSDLQKRTANSCSSKPLPHPTLIQGERESTLLVDKHPNVGIPHQPLGSLKLLSNLLLRELFDGGVVLAALGFGLLALLVVVDGQLLQGLEHILYFVLGGVILGLKEKIR